MKRKIFFIVASILMYGSTYAQNHYNFNPRDYQFNLGIVAQIKINGVEQTSNDLELGAFNGESIRGSQRIGQYGSAGYYRAIIQIYGNPATSATWASHTQYYGQLHTPSATTANLSSSTSSPCKPLKSPSPPTLAIRITTTSSPPPSGQ